MDNQVFRQKSMDRFTSPEELDNYLHVTTPSVWVLLCAIVLLLAGLLAWSSFAAVESYASGTAYAENGMLTVVLDDELSARNVQVGMQAVVGKETAPVSSVGRDAEGRIIAGVSMELPDGIYEARISYRQTQLIQMLFR